MAFVLDASVTLAWAFADEAHPTAEAALDLLQTEDGAAPALWWFELRNALLAGERRHRIDQATTSAFLRRLARLPIQIDRTPDEATLLDLARRHRLTVYDAAYLELAQRRGLPLATLDQELLQAASDAGVALVGAKP